MSDEEHCRRMSEDLLRKAMATSDLSERGRLMSEAAHWHMRGLDAKSTDLPPPMENGEGDDHR